MKWNCEGFPMGGLLFWILSTLHHSSVLGKCRNKVVNKKGVSYILSKRQIRFMSLIQKDIGDCVCTNFI